MSEIKREWTLIPSSQEGVFYRLTHEGVKGPFHRAPFWQHIPGVFLVVHFDKKLYTQQQAHAALVKRAWFGKHAFDGFIELDYSESEYYMWAHRE